MITFQRWDFTFSWMSTSRESSLNEWKPLQYLFRHRKKCSSFNQNRRLQQWWVMYLTLDWVLAQMKFWCWEFSHKGWNQHHTQVLMAPSCFNGNYTLRICVFQYKYKMEETQAFRNVNKYLCQHGDVIWSCIMYLYGHTFHIAYGDNIYNTVKWLDTNIQCKLLFSGFVMCLSGWIGRKCEELVWQGNKYVLGYNIGTILKNHTFFHLRRYNAVVPGMCAFPGDTAVLHMVSAGA